MVSKGIDTVIRALAIGLGLALVAVAAPRQGSAQETDYDLEKRKLSVAEAIEEVTTSDPGVQRFFDESYGYAVFPSVGKGGFVVGGAHGNGLVYEQGALVGQASLKQVNVGLQMGGQSYIQVLFFQGEQDLARFRENKLEFSGQASAVAITEGASADVDYAKGVAVITKAKGGLMYEASLGGQTFDYKPIGN
jgi:lipid-binding SYLF domain-containing protein